MARPTTTAAKMYIAVRILPKWTQLRVIQESSQLAASFIQTRISHPLKPPPVRQKHQRGQHDRKCECAARQIGVVLGFRLGLFPPMHWSPPLVAVTSWPTLAVSWRDMPKEKRPQPWGKAEAAIRACRGRPGNNPKTQTLCFSSGLGQKILKRSVSGTGRNFYKQLPLFRRWNTKASNTQSCRQPARVVGDGPCSWMLAGQGPAPRSQKATLFFKR
jgi:hypothetical protein